ncbi:ribbon-helix-helix protein, CopG family [Methanolapillus ohkumae]
MSISLSVSPSTLTKLKNLEATEKFGSISDIVYISVCEFLGKIKIYKKESNWDYGLLMDFAAEDKLPKGKISISLSPYVDDEIKKISGRTGKSKSLIIRAAIDDFVNGYNDTESEEIRPFIPVQKMNAVDLRLYRNELKNIMRELLEEIKVEQ